MLTLITAPLFPASAGTSSTVESKAASLFKAGDYPEVTSLYRDLPPDATPSKEFLRLSLLSYVRLGRTDEALAIYAKLIQPGQPHDVSLLRPLALGVITSHVRDRKEQVRIAAYSALAELGLPETARFWRMAYWTLRWSYAREPPRRSEKPDSRRSPVPCVAHCGMTCRPSASRR